MSYDFGVKKKKKSISGLVFKLKQHFFKHEKKKKKNHKMTLGELGGIMIQTTCIAMDTWYTCTLCSSLHMFKYMDVFIYTVVPCNKTFFGSLNLQTTTFPL